MGITSGRLDAVDEKQGDADDTDDDRLDGGAGGQKAVNDGGDDKRHAALPPACHQIFQVEEFHARKIPQKCGRWGATVIHIRVAFNLGGGYYWRISCVGRGFAVGAIGIYRQFQTGDSRCGATWWRGTGR